MTTDCRQPRLTTPGETMTYAPTWEPRDTNYGGHEDEEGGPKGAPKVGQVAEPTAEEGLTP